MFNLVRRNLTFPVLKATSVHRLFPRSSCSSPAASDNSFAVSYLIGSFGFPLHKEISASKCFNIKTPDRADSVRTLFKNRGFTETEISLLVRKFPRVLKCNPEKTLLPKFEFLSSIGLSESDVVKILTSNPTALVKSLKNHIEPTFNSLKKLLQSNDRTLIAMKRYPWYRGLNYQTHLAPNIQLLQDIGVPISKMLYGLTYLPRDYVGSTERFKKAVEEVAEMGFDPLKLNFMLAVSLIRSMSKSTWEKKMEIYKKWGWSKAQIYQAFKAYPWFMKTSEKKINKGMDFHVNKMGFETAFVAQHAMILSYSLEKRTIPRSLVYKYCLNNGLMKDKNYTNYNGWLNCKEDIFIKRLKRYERKA